MEDIHLLADIDEDVGNHMAATSNDGWVKVCQICGNVYADRQLHVRWHERLWIALGGDERALS